MLGKLREIARERYCEEDFKYHIVPVVRNALILAGRLGADREVVEAAAYLHDIGRAGPRKGFRVENDHHIEGMEESRRILEGLGCDEGSNRKVEHCVLTHRGRKGPDPETLEVEIVNNADAMAHFDTFLDMFMFIMETNTFEETVQRIREKTERNWNRKLTLPVAREMVKEKYEAVMVILRSMGEYIKWN